MWAQFVGADVRARSPQEMSVFVLPEQGEASLGAITGEYVRPNIVINRVVPHDRQVKLFSWCVQLHQLI